MPEDETALTGESTEPAQLEVDIANDFYAAIRRERDAEVEAYRKYVSNPRYVEHLQQALGLLQAPVALTPGKLVQWKTFLKGAQFPEYGAPAVVVEVLEHPRMTDDDGDPLPHPVDVFIGYLDGDQELRILATDSRRLALWDIESGN